MFIIVRHLGNERCVDTPPNNPDNCRRMAFRLVYGRRESDFQELMDNTTRIEVEKLSEQTAFFLMRMT